MKKNHNEYFKRAIEVSREARNSGNTPFGAILVDEEGNIVLEQGNAEKANKDATAHAELTLASRASQTFDKDFLWNCTLYTTCEPCPMCMGGIYWANIGHVAYGITEKKLLELTGDDPKNLTFNMGADKVIAAGQRKIELLGPFNELADEIVEVHEGFWS